MFIYGPTRLTCYFDSGVWAIIYLDKFFFFVKDWDNIANGKTIQHVSIN